jgi:hypothetical protein
MSGKIVHLRQAKKYRNATSRLKGRRANDAYRVREHLTEAEMDKLLAALKRHRCGRQGGDTFHGSERPSRRPGRTPPSDSDVLRLGGLNGAVGADGP